LLCRRVGSGSAPALAPGMRGDMNRAVEAMAQTVRAVRAEERGSTVLAARSRRTLFRGSKRAEPRNPAGRPGLEKAHFASNPATAHLISVALYGLEDEETRH